MYVPVCITGMYVGQYVCTSMYYWYVCKPVCMYQYVFTGMYVSQYVCTSMYLLVCM